MTRLLTSVLAALLLAGCMTRFITGPARDVKLGAITVTVDRCTTAAATFDCRSAPAVADYLRDYFKLNGVPAPTGAGPTATAKLRISEDNGAVAAEVEVATGTGLAWRAEAYGDTLLRALVRLEDSLAARAGMKTRFLTAPDVGEPLRQLGRKEVSAEKNSFTYK